MEDMENKLGAILGNPEMMQKIMAIIMDGEVMLLVQIGEVIGACQRTWNGLNCETPVLGHGLKKMVLMVIW